MRKKLIKVTKSDIKKGKKNKEKFCPIARATCRAFKKKLGTFFITGYTFHNDGNIRGGLPKVASDFIGLYDDGFHVEPFQFLLEY